MHGTAHLASAGSDVWYYGAVFVLGWTLMTVAMMLPTVVPLLVLFRRMVERRTNSVVLLSLVVGGYLVVWVLFGIFVQLVNRWLARGLLPGGWTASPWIPATAILTVAGLYQFSSLKYACLEKCRTPMSFIISRWQGGAEHVQALRIGLDHGVFCVGCCWSLMLLMFLVSAGSLGWMALLGVVMAIEKNFSWGRHVSKPIGAMLLAAAAFVTSRGLYQGT